MRVSVLIFTFIFRKQRQTHTRKKTSAFTCCCDMLRMLRYTSRVKLFYCVWFLKPQINNEIDVKANWLDPPCFLGALMLGLLLLCAYVSFVVMKVNGASSKHYISVKKVSRVAARCFVCSVFAVENQRVRCVRALGLHSARGVSQKIIIASLSLILL